MLMQFASLEKANAVAKKMKYFSEQYNNLVIQATFNQDS